MLHDAIKLDISDGVYDMYSACSRLGCYIFHCNIENIATRYKNICNINA